MSARNGRYEAMFARLAENREGAFGAFVMLGDPDVAGSAEILDALVAGGADMIEVGIPFSDPIADGPTIQAAAERALRQGVKTADCFTILSGFRRRHPHIPVGVLTYANLVLARGIDAFYSAAARAGVDSVLVADAPVFESLPFVSAARANGIDSVLVAAPNTPDATLRKIAVLGSGYTYCVARAGVTGSGAKLQLDHGSLLTQLHILGAPPAVLGFGISSPEHVAEALAARAAGVISGSKIVEFIAQEPENAALSIRDFVASMKAATKVGTDPTHLRSISEGLFRPA